jgi:hypothetical protein
MATVALFIALIDMKLPVTRKNTELKMNVNGEIIVCRRVYLPFCDQRRRDESENRKM